LVVNETLKLLEWERLCQHLSTFALTNLGTIAARHLQIPTSLAQSEYLLAQTKEMFLLEDKLSVPLTLEGIKDIGEALARVELGATLTPQELLAIATTLAGVRQLRRFIEDQEDDYPTLTGLMAELRTHPEVENRIHFCISEQGEIEDRANPKLQEIRVSIKSYRDRIYRSLQTTIQRHSNALQENIITQRRDRFVLAVKPSYKATIPGILHDESATGSTLFIEPHNIVELGNRLGQLVRQEQREIEKVLQELSELVLGQLEDLELVLATATTLDLAIAKARYSRWLEGYAPVFITPGRDRVIALRSLRHPLLWWQQRREGSNPVIPITVNIEPITRVVAITGPNTGGKTVTLKTLGIVALMAKVGLFVPSREPVEIPWFDQVLADIGDEQSLQQSLSTFSGHIKRISRIIEGLGLGEQNLVLLDEVGAGTDPAEGSALAIALLKYLADHATLTIATTHYGELKALKYQDNRFENASVEFDDVSLQPTYKLLWGIPGRSNALSIAKRLGLEEAIVDQAANYVGGYSQDINEMIAGLEAEKREQEEKARSAQTLLAQTEAFYREVTAKAQQLQAREEELKQQQEQEVRAAIAEAKTEIAQVIRKLQQGKPTAQKAHLSTQSLDAIATTALPTKVKPPKPSYAPQVGERVRIPSLGQTAEVIAIENDGAAINVKFGMMKMTIDATEIESLQGEKVEVKPKPPAQSKKKKAEPKQPETISTVQTEQNTVDLRGARLHQAEMELENAIAKAVGVGLHVLWIIHGKGTGKLRQGVHDFLKHHPQIDRYELAPANKGGSGATISYLK
jgi:DNA mismatch repair protein MutS2